MKSIKISRIQDEIQGRHIGENDKFSFVCHTGIECFNSCCKNLNMFLYPYDVLRLKNSLNKTADEFIEDHVDLIFREGNYFPDVLLRMKDNKDMSCPFLSSDGCSVYLDRPYTCRTFPIEQGILKGSVSKSDRVLNFFRPPKFCMGQNETTEWTMKTWSENQNAVLHKKMTILWSDVKQMFNINPWEDDNRLSKIKLRMAFIAAYNIEQFNEFVFKSSFLKRYKINNKTLKKIKYNEVNLLKLGFDWIKLFVWKIKSPTITTRR